MLSRSVCVGLCLAAATLAACGDSTAPHPVTPAQLARHLDSLITVWEANDDLRFSLLGGAEIPPANGAAPIALKVTTRSGIQTWQGLILKYADTLVIGTVYDSIYVLYAYSDYAMTNVMMAQTIFYNTRSVANFYALIDTTLISTASGSGTQTFETTASGSQCQLISGLKHYADYSGNATACNLATFNAELSWNFPGAYGEAVDYATITIASQPVNGVILR